MQDRGRLLWMFGRRGGGRRRFGRGRSGVGWLGRWLGRGVRLGRGVGCWTWTGIGKVVMRW